MAQMTVHTLVVDSAGQPVLVLRPMAEGSGPTVLLPIWIGPAEAAAILVALLTVSAQTLRAAMTNPSTTLRYE